MPLLQGLERGSGSIAGIELQQEVGNVVLDGPLASARTSMFVLGLSGTAFASFGPFALSLCCLRLAGRVHPRWAVHLFFIPCAYAMVHAGASMLDFADGRPWTNEPAGYALTAAFLLFGLTVLVHVVAVTFEIGAAIRRRRANIG